MSKVYYAVELDHGVFLDMELDGKRNGPAIAVPMDHMGTQKVLLPGIIKAIRLDHVAGVGNKWSSVARALGCHFSSLEREEISIDLPPEQAARLSKFFTPEPMHQAELPVDDERCKGPKALRGGPCAKRT